MAKGSSHVPLRKLFGTHPFRAGEVTGESLPFQEIDERRRQRKFAMDQQREAERKARKYDELKKSLHKILIEKQVHPGTRLRMVKDLYEKHAA